MKVCPSGIFTQSQAEQFIKVENVNSCIICGHCVSVCPTGSVHHTEFPAQKVHAIDYTQMPTPEQVMLLCKSRRSNRTITKKPVPAEMLDTIIEAAHRAPTATNAQTVSFTLVTDPQKLRMVSEFTITVFDKVARKLLNPFIKLILKPLLPNVYKYVPVFERLKEEDKAGKDPILRNATALILIHSPQSNRFGREDCNLAYQNASLMAESLGISQIYMGFVLTAIKQENEGTLAKLLKIEGKIHAVMALGIPAFRYPNYTDRKESNVNKI